MTYEKSLEEAVKIAQDAAKNSPDPYARMKARFGSMVYLPMSKWLGDEIERGKTDKVRFDRLVPDMMSCIAAGLGRVIAAFIVYSIKEDAAPNAAQHIASTFIDALDKVVREEIESATEYRKQKNTV
jgi:hypothetical protein